MNERPTQTLAAGSLLPLADDLHPRRPWTLMRRAIWLALVLFSLTVLAASLSPSLHQLQATCTGSACSPSQLTPEQAHTLRATLGFSLGTYALCVLMLDVASALTWVVVGVFLWRKFDRVIVLLLALQAVTQGVLGSNAFAPNGVVDALARSQSPWQVPAMLLEILNQVLLFFVLGLFPSGRFVPRWTRWVALSWVAIEASFFAARISPSLRSSIPTFDVLFLPVILIGIIAQVYRYRSVSTLVEREQTKWVVFGLLASNAVQVALVVTQASFAALRQANSLYGPAASLALTLAFLFPPATVIIAVLRYRLWDIDIIIRRTLIYGSLTGILAALYFGLVLGAQSVVQALTRQTNPQPVIIVASTLLIAALFNPLRHGLQATIDRRFYRRKYDAARTLAAFGQTLRTETDLSELSAQLMAVVQETMQPASVSLWLRQPDYGAKHPAQVARTAEGLGQAEDDI
jgi:hypothetical protein